MLTAPIPARDVRVIKVHSLVINQGFFFLQKFIKSIQDELTEKRMRICVKRVKESDLYDLNDLVSKINILEYILTDLEASLIDFVKDDANFTEDVAVHNTTVNSSWRIKWKLKNLWTKIKNLWNRPTQILK